MIDTEHEIRMQYRDAARPNEQVHILAETNGCDPEDIAAIIGLPEVPRRYQASMDTSRRKYDWDTIFAELDAGARVVDIVAKYGMNKKTVTAKRRKRRGQEINQSL